MSTPTLTPSQFSFHAHAFIADSDMPQLGAYGARPSVLSAAGQALHKELGLGPDEFLSGGGTFHQAPGAPAEVDVAVNVAGVAKYGRGEAVLVSVAGFGPSGVCAWTPDLDLAAPGKAQNVAYYRRRDDGMFDLSPLPAELKAKLKALVPTKAKASAKADAAVLCAEEDIYAVRFSPDGRLLAAGDGTGRLTLFDVATGHATGSVSLGTTACWAIAFAPDGKTVVAGTHALKEIDVATVKAVGKLAAHGDRVQAVAFSPSGKLLASTGGSKLIVWDRDKNEKRYAATVYNADYLAFIDEDHIIASVMGGIRRFDLTAKPPKHGPPHLVGPAGFAPIRDGMLMRHGDGSFVVYDATATTPGRAVALPKLRIFATDGAALVLGQEVGAVSRGIVADVTTGSVVRALDALPPTGHGEPMIHGFACAPDGRIAVCAGRGITVYNADGTLHLAPKAA